MVYGMMRLWHHDTVTGGTAHGPSTVCRCAVSPDGVSGFHQPDARRVSAAGPALRGGVPSAYGGVAPRWETPDRSPVCRLQELPPADAGRSAVLSAHLLEDLRAPSRPGTPVRHGSEQSESMDSRPAPRAAGGCIGKKGATYATFFWGFTNVWCVSRAWASADRWVAVMLTGSKPGV